MAKRIRKVIAILLIITSVLLMLMPPSSSMAATDVGDYSINGNSLVKYNGTDANLTLPKTITTIGKDAFSGNNSIVKVTIPDSVRTIDFAAFENCKNLKEVIIPSSVKAIGSSAFCGCANLKTINIPKKCESIGSAAFAGCDKLATISVDPANENYVVFDGVLYTRDGKKVVQYLAGRTKSSYSMPITVENIEEYCFYGASNLTDISLSSKIDTIPEYAFSNCKGLRKVTIPYNVEALNAYSFSDCYNLESVEVPDSVAYIDDKAFYLTNNVTVNYYDSEQVKMNDELNDQEESFEEYMANTQVFGNGYSIYVSGSANKKDLYRDLPYVSSYTPDYSNNTLDNELASGKIIGGNAMIFMNRDVEVIGADIEDLESEDAIDYDDSQALSNDLTSENNVNTEGLIILSNKLTRYISNASDISIPDSVNSIGNRAFYKKPVTNVNLTKNLKEINDFSFARSAINSIDIPTGTESIGYAAFYNCPNLANVNIPDSVKNIELGAFDGTPWINNWENSVRENDYLIVGDGILLRYKGLKTQLLIPQGVKTIAAGAFKGNSKIQSVTLPDSLVKIGEDAFNGCSNLTSINLPVSLTTIEDRAFKDCNFSELVIPKNVSTIGLGAFDEMGISTGNRSNLKTVVFLGNTLPKLSYKPTATRLSATSLRKEAFNGVDNAIIGNNSSVTSDSVLCADNKGFRGSVYKITSEGGSKTGEIYLVYESLEPSLEGLVTINPHVFFEDKEYMLSGVNDNAFDAYGNLSEWSDYSLKNISINGKKSPELNAFLGRINSKYATKGSTSNQNSENISQNTIKVNYDTTLSFDTDGAQAYIPEGNLDGTLNISFDDTKAEAVRNALASRYGSADAYDFIPLDISLYNNKNKIPITNLSGQKATITMPIPKDYVLASDINVGALNDNGEFEELASEIVTEGSNDKIRFIAGHFSTYVIYINNYTESIITQETEKANAFNTTGGIVKSLSKPVYGIEAKWFVIVIMLAFAVILLIYKPRKNT